MLVACLNCGTSVFAGFVIFSVIGHMSVRSGIPVSEVATQGIASLHISLSITVYNVQC